MSDFDPIMFLDAARAALPFLPATAALDVSMLEPGDPTPMVGMPAVGGNVPGTPEYDLLIVPTGQVAEALSGAEGMSAGEALAPALEAAVGQLGIGQLGAAGEVDVPEDLVAGGWQVATFSADGAVQGWFAVRSSQQEAPAAAEPGEEVPLEVATAEQRAHSMKLLYKVEMTLTAEIGRAKLPIKDVIELTPGAVIELDRSAGAPADVMVNGRLIARGEIVVVDEEYGIRITEIVSLAEQEE